MANLETAPIEEPLRATLAFLKKLTKDHGSVTPDDINHLFELGVSRVQIEDALSVCFAFNVIDRLADTFHFHVGDKKSFDIGANMLLKRGYKV
jgi:hypothetical protein